MKLLHSVKTLRGFSIGATDGDLGHVDDMYFDDRHWAIRYLVIDTGGWLGGRKVLLSPSAVTAVDWGNGTVRVNLTRKQVEDSPDVDTDQPVSRQHETQLHDYYNQPYYWNGPFLWGASAAPGLVPSMIGQSQMTDPVPPADTDAGNDARQAREQAQEQGDPHLRSCNAIVGYAIKARDGELGELDDCLFDDSNWRIMQAVVDTSNWWPGQEAMIDLDRIRSIDWEARAVEVDMTQEEIQNSPEYDPSRPPAVGSDGGRGIQPQ